ncbi:MAG TPA: hypothetical protein VGT61_00715 [Thermomicrobiales bacterium]|jgi:hypothetical protein|nr:hypothetical protein [Thermomicrobiales bacterium]
MFDGSDGYRILVDPARNALRLLLLPGSAGEAAALTRHSATLDVGEGGRLIGLEVEPDGATSEPGWYLELEPAPGPFSRSVEVTVTAGRDASGRATWLEWPRRGPGYEITFPSGNQCWVRPRRRAT